MFIFRKKAAKISDELNLIIKSEINDFMVNLTQAVNNFEGDFNKLSLRNLEMHGVKQSLNQASLNLDKISSKWNEKNSITAALSKILKLNWETYNLNIEWRMLTLNDDFDMENYSHREKYQFFVFKNRANEKKLVKYLTDLKAAYKEVFNSALDV